VVVAAGAAGVATVVVLAVAGVLLVVVAAAGGRCTVVRSCMVHAAVARASVKPMIKNFMRAPCAWRAQVAT